MGAEPRSRKGSRASLHPVTPTLPGLPPPTPPSCIENHAMSFGAACVQCLTCKWPHCARMEA